MIGLGCPAHPCPARPRPGMSLTVVGDRPCERAGISLEGQSPGGSRPERANYEQGRRFANRINGQITAGGPFGPQLTRPRTGGWHDSDQRHGLEQATDISISSSSSDEERLFARAARARDRAGRARPGPDCRRAGPGGGTGGNRLRQLERQNADDALAEKRHLTVEIDENADDAHAHAEQSCRTG